MDVKAAYLKTVVNQIPSLTHVLNKIDLESSRHKFECHCVALPSTLQEEEDLFLSLRRLGYKVWNVEHPLISSPERVEFDIAWHLDWEQL